MKKLEWYVFQNDQQLGPFAAEQVSQLNANKMISHNAYIFKMGWEEWLPITESWEQLGLDGKAPTVDIPTPSARKGGFASRVTVGGSVIIHNEQSVVHGNGANISETGLFIETEEQIFNVGDYVKVTLRINEMSRPYNTEAQIVRFNSNSKWAVGYGLMFHEPPSKLVSEIKKIIELKRHEGQLKVQKKRKMKVAS